MPSAALYPHTLALSLQRMLNIQIGELIHYTAAENLATVILPD